MSAATWLVLTFPTGLMLWSKGWPPTLSTRRTNGWTLPLLSCRVPNRLNVRSSTSLDCRRKAQPLVAGRAQG